MTISESTTLRQPFTRDDLEAWLLGIPSDARISVHHTTGDRPWESTQYRIEASWTRGSAK